jgi:hypothetical protein
MPLVVFVSPSCNLAGMACFLEGVRLFRAGGAAEDYLQFSDAE